MGKAKGKMVVAKDLEVNHRLKEKARINPLRYHHLRRKVNLKREEKKIKKINSLVSVQL